MTTRSESQNMYIQFFKKREQIAMRIKQKEREDGEEN